MCGSAETQRGPAADYDVTPYPGDESLRLSYPGDEGDSNRKLQIGAGERRAVPAGNSFKTTATIDVAVDDDERNDAESERRQLERAAEQPSTKRRPTPAETDDVARRRKRALTHDRGFPSAAPAPFFLACTHADCSSNYKMEELPAKPEERPNGEAGRPQDASPSPKTRTRPKAIVAARSSKPDKNSQARAI